MADKTTSMADKTTSPLMGTVKYRNGSNFRKTLNQALNIFLKDALRVALTNPLQAYSFVRTLSWQQKAARVRSKLEREGIHVPPIMILSVTNRCNLHCKGCYHQALDRSSQPEMSESKLRSIFVEAKELGISFMVLAGGEPLVRREILDMTKNFPEIIFLVFTNGLLIDDEVIAKLKGQRNFVPVISLEGWEEDTDARRGKGVYEHLQGIIGKIKSIDLFWSVALTVTRSNFATVTDDQFIQALTDLGCKLFFFVEYTPITEGTEDWVITDEQRVNLLDLRDSFRSKFSALFIAVPGDEEEIGGCLSAGRGFVHVSAEGNVEPCPFSPYSDTNLRDSSLKDALQSEFLKTIRQNNEQLSETEGGCALWIKREWVRSLQQTD
ncbi:MAG: radical SAM protein [Methanocellales archaeon]|nr:radical SAM protein [Methanocellales archaeon]MDD5446611.1 radical SAM protein [Methanocellales archaeon]